MLFTFLVISLLAVGLTQPTLHPAVPRLGALTILGALPLVASANVSLFSNQFVLTNTTAALTILLLIVGAALLLSANYSWSPDSYPIFGFASLLGGRLLRSSNDLIALFLAIELQSFPLYLRAASDTKSLTASGSALKYFLLGALSTALILRGSASQYLYSGTTAITPWNTTSLLLILAGRLFKRSAAPFHSWAPAVYDGVRAHVAAWLQALPKVAALAFVASTSTALLFSAALSLVIGALYGLAQTRIRPLLAYSTVAHVGFMLLSPDARILYLISYSFTTILTILSANALAPSGTIAQLSGTGRSNPFLALTFALGLLSLAGIPPRFGFYAKATVLSYVIYEHPALAFLAVVSSIISAYYYLARIANRFFENATQPARTGTIEAYILSSVLALIVAYPLIHELILNINTLVNLP